MLLLQMNFKPYRKESVNHIQTFLLTSVVILCVSDIPFAYEISLATGVTAGSDLLEWKGWVDSFQLSIVISVILLFGFSAIKVFFDIVTKWKQGGHSWFLWRMSAENVRQSMWSLRASICSWRGSNSMNSDSTVCDNVSAARTSASRRTPKQQSSQVNPTRTSSNPADTELLVPMKRIPADTSHSTLTQPLLGAFPTSPKDAKA